MPTAVFLNASIRLRTLWSKSTLFLHSVGVSWRPQKKRLKTSLSPSPSRSYKEPPQVQAKKLCSVKFQADPLRGILWTPPRSLFKCLILETPLWQCTMSSNLKSLLEGLKTQSVRRARRPLGRPSRMLHLPIYTKNKKPSKSRWNFLT